MKNSILKISALLMASILLFSTLSFTIQKHICAGEVADVAFFGNLESCTMHDNQNENSSSSFENQTCCQDSSYFVRGSNSELRTSSNSQDDINVLAVVFLYSYITSFETFEKDPNNTKDYSAPIVIKDIPILYETFLI